MAKILLVEDEALVRDMYQKKLELSKFDVETASDGKEGLRKARELKPDLILLDIIMPHLDGIQVLMKIKNDPELKEIPVVMLTNIESNKHKKECFHEGAAGYIVKSDGTPSIVLKEVNKILS